MTKGIFITFEGGDGAGKTTLIEGVRAHLAQAGKQVVVTREPGSTPLGEKIREWLLAPKGEVPISPKAELLLFLASRAQHIEEVIQPSLQEGKTILCDRFNDSSIAYQGLGRGLGLDYVESLCDTVCRPVVPDATFYLDLEPHEGLKRSRQASGEHDRMEKAGDDFHLKVREGFLQLAERHPRIHLLDATQQPEQVLREALDYLEKIS